MTDRDQRSSPAYADRLPGRRASDRARFSDPSAHDVHRVATLDLAGRIIAVDATTRERETAAVINVHLGDLWNAEGRARSEIALTAARAGRIGRFVAESAKHGRWWELILAPVMDGAGSPERLIAIGRDVTNARRERDALERTLDELEFLGCIGRILATTLDSEAMLRDVARACTRSIADLCIVELREPDGSLTTVTAAHADPVFEAEFLDVAAALAREHGRPDHPIVASLSYGGSTFVPDVEEAELLRAPCCRTHATMLRTLEYRSLIVVPFARGDERLGAITLVSTGESPLRFDERKLALAEEIARRIATALENARRYSHERVIATTLQASALPLALPRVDGFRFDAVYAPGREEATIGGDWYDVVALGDGRIALTIGDVEGNGLRAAVTMIKIRQAMQSTALLRSDPLEMLRAADLTLTHHDPEHYATALAAIFDPIRGELVFASAGHPAPLLRDAAGTVTEIRCSGTMLGIGVVRTAQTRRIRLRPGSLVIFFTDGLIEATRDIEAGYAALHKAIASAEVIRSPRPARAIFNRILESDPTDDVAILTIGATPVSAERTDRPPIDVPVIRSMLYGRIEG